MNQRTHKTPQRSALAPSRVWQCARFENSYDLHSAQLPSRPHPSMDAKEGNLVDALGATAREEALDKAQDDAADADYERRVPRVRAERLGQREAQRDGGHSHRELSVRIEKAEHANRQHS